MTWIKTSSKSQRAVLGLSLGVILLLAVNIFSNMVFKPFQLDLTENRLFTVSAGTQKILEGLDEPVTLRLYFTKELGEGNPDHARHFVRVRELLDRYTGLANDKIRLELFDAAPFSGPEDKAMAFGLNGIPFNESGDLGYFGLVGTNSTDDVELIRLFSPDRESFLEYDITKLIYRLANPKKKAVGLISSLPIGGAGTVPNRDAPRWPFIDQLREFFSVEPLPSYVEEIPDHIDVLLIIHPKKLDKYALYAIDQFVLNGGRALVFLDPVVESSAKVGAPNTLGTQSQFDLLLSKWGLAFLPEGVATDLDAARRIRVRHEGRIEVADYVAWLMLGPENFDTTDVVTGDISRLNMGTAGVLKKLPNTDTTITPLVTTGPRSMAVNSRQFFGQPDVIGLFRGFKPSNERLMLVARATGNAKSAFPAGGPSIKITAPTADKATTRAEGTERKHLAASRVPINTIVVSDVDMLHDEFWADLSEEGGRQMLVPNANNIDFLINALDNLTGSSALIELRGRTQTSRPFHMIQRIRQNAEQQFRQKERQLQERLAKARSEMEAITSGSTRDGQVTLSKEQRERIDVFRTEMLQTRKELRDVQRALRNDLERLDSWLKFINIGAVPILLILGAILVGIWRRRHNGKTVKPQGKAAA